MDSKAYITSPQFPFQLRSIQDAKAFPLELQSRTEQNIIWYRNSLREVLSNELILNTHGWIWRATGVCVLRFKEKIRSSPGKTFSA